MEPPCRFDVYILHQTCMMVADASVMACGHTVCTVCRQVFGVQCTVGPPWPFWLQYKTDCSLVACPISPRLPHLAASALLELCSALHFCRAAEHASMIFPGGVNLDLIFGRQGQTLQSWKRELSEVGGWALVQWTLRHNCLSLLLSMLPLIYASLLLKAMQSCDGHMSLYQLTVEQGTPLARDVEQGTVVCVYATPTHTHT